MPALPHPLGTDGNSVDIKIDRWAFSHFGSHGLCRVLSNAFALNNLGSINVHGSSQGHVGLLIFRVVQCFRGLQDKGKPSESSMEGQEHQIITKRSWLGREGRTCLTEGQREVRTGNNQVPWGWVFHQSHHVFSQQYSQIWGPWNKRKSKTLKIILVYPHS